MRQSEKSECVWIACIGEPLPSDGKNVRYLRAFSLALRLEKAKIKTVFWGATFDHNRRIQRYNETVEVAHSSYLSTIYLYGRSYLKNVSLSRFINHASTAARFFWAGLTRERPSVIVASMPSIEMALAAVLIGKIRGIPVVIDVRDMWPDIWPHIATGSIRRFAILAVALYRPLLWIVLRHATALVAITDGFIEWAISRGASREKPMQTFPLSYSHKRYDAAAVSEAEAECKAYGIQLDGRTLCVFAGTFMRRSDLKTVIAAAKRLDEEFPSKFQFVLCGEGEGWADAKAAAGDCASIVMPGWVNGALIALLLRKASFGILPYPNDPDFLISYPNKFLEYLASGLPVVTSLRGEVAVLLTSYQAGLVYDQGDPDSLMRHLRATVEEPGCIQAMALNVEKLHSKFDADQVFAHYVDFLIRISRRLLK